MILAVRLGEMIPMESGSTGNLPVPGGNLPHGTVDVPSGTKRRAPHSRGAGGLAARPDGPVPCATLYELNRPDVEQGAYPHGV